MEDIVPGSNRVPYVKLMDGTDDSTTVIPYSATDGFKVQVTGSTGAVDTELPAAAALADAAANPTTPTVGAGALSFNGTTWDRMRGDTANGLDVDVTRLPASTVAGSTSLPAGTNNIGDVDVLTLPALVAGSAIIGKVGIDQTTPGTTNRVDIGAALPAGTNNIGDIDVLTLPALPAGTNNIGDVDVLTLPAIPAGSNKIGAVDLDSDATTGSAVPAVAQFVAGTDGTNARALKTDTSGELQVDVLSLPAVDTELPAAGALGDAMSNPTTPLIGSCGMLWNDGTWVRAPGNGTDGATVKVNFALPQGSNTIGNVGLATRTSGGATTSRTISAASTNGTNVKGTAGQVYGIQVSNINAAARYLKLYNKATAPTVGTDTPTHTFLLPASGNVNLNFEYGLAFGTGIGFGLTTGLADADTGAVSANEHVVHIFYA